MAGEDAGPARLQCRNGGGMAEVELDAARTLADLAGIGLRAERTPTEAIAREEQGIKHHVEEEEKASTRLSLELGNVGIRSSSASSSSVDAASRGPRSKQLLTETEKQAKKLRRVLANRESARQTILRRQAIRDELARKVAYLSLQNASMRTEKEMVTKEYLSLKETNEQLQEQVAETAKKAICETKPEIAATLAVPLAAATTPPPPPPPPPPATKFPVTLYTAAPTPVAHYVWGAAATSRPPRGPGYEHASPAVTGPDHPALCLPPCAWYYPLLHELRGSSCADVYAQPFRCHGGASEPGNGDGGSSRQQQPGHCADDYEKKTSVRNLEEPDDDTCSLTLAINIDKKAGNECNNSRVQDRTHDKMSLCTRELHCDLDAKNDKVVALEAELAGPSAAEKMVATATTAEARKRRKELTKLKQARGNARQGGAQW